MIEHWHTRTVEDLFGELNSQYQGLSSTEASLRLKRDGLNQLTPGKKKPLLSRLIQQMKDPMILVLLAAAGLSYWASGGEDWLDASIILLIVMVNNLIAISQEDSAQKALEALEQLTAPLSTVMRDGREVKIPSQEVVVGDVLVLHTGDSISADARLMKAVALEVDESAMTGESDGIEKRLANSLPEDTPMAEWSNFLIAGTLVTAGHGKALVVATGMATQMGRIAQLLQDNRPQISPLQEKMNEVSKTLSLLCLGICAVMFGIGLLQGKDLLTMFMTAVALAVAAIPEGLPAVVSIVLALGMSRMAKRGAIVKKLPAVETLGAASVICSDKTGTLTENKMTVQECYTLPHTDPQEALKGVLLCTQAQVSWKAGAPVVKGSATESALALYAVKQGLDKEQLQGEYPKVEEIPFSSQRKRMSSLHPHPQGGYLVVVKGAPDVLLPLCSHSLLGPMNHRLRQEILEKNDSMAGQSMRVIAVAQRTIPYIPPKLQEEHLEQGLCFLGLFGLLDPPRPEAKAAVAECHKANIKPVMITGDHRSTAIAIAKELDIFRHRDLAITGAELDFMPQELLEEDIHRFSVFARVSPQHKMRIVQAWQRKGNVVAVTGDGVNDAPALKAADIGCAMGVTGTDVAKSAAEMILTQDNFDTIVDAVEEGRGIYANIKKAIHYLLSCNIGEIVTIFVATLLNFATMPLVPVQLLWLNLVTDTLPALALGVEPVEEGIMQQPPRGKEESLFQREFTLRLLWQGIMIGCLTLSAYGLGYHFLASPGEEGATANTMAFATLTLSQLFHAFNVRSEDKSLLHQGLFSNPAMNRAFCLGLCLQVAVLSLPPLQEVFSVTPMGQEQWITVLALAMLPIPLCELSKVHARRIPHQGKRIMTKDEVKELRDLQLLKQEQQRELALSYQEQEEPSYSYLPK